MNVRMTRGKTLFRGGTPFITACRSGFADVASLLLGARADLDASDDLGHRLRDKKG